MSAVAGEAAGARSAAAHIVHVLAGAAGLVFGLGLILSRMVDPARVLAFLDVTRDWNPSLALVMGGAVAAAIPAFFYARRHALTPTGEPFQLPQRTPITGKLVLGATLFGAGWGLSGWCPGPSLVIAASGNFPALAFVAAMAAGYVASRSLSNR